MRLVLRVSDDEEALAFGFEAAELILEPGDSRTLAVEASLRDQTVSNERRVRGFSIEAHGDAGGVRLAEVAGELLPPPIETARTASGKAPAERVGRRYGWRQVFIPIYVVGMIASLLLALVDTANWEGWAMLLGAWTVGLPLAALAWRTTSPLKIGGKLVTRVGCLGFVLVASLLGGLVAWALLNELTGRNG
jgi:hypothetical protein